MTIELSSVARDILAYVNRPPAARTPRGYQRQFLDDYVPNKTAYIPDKTKVHLHRVGKPIAADRAGTFARDILSRFLIDLSWASSRLEGNTYSRLDTERLIQFGQEAEGKDAKETQMILNHKAAIELLVEDNTDDIGINRFTLLNLHALLSENLMADPEASGHLRRRPVNIGGSVYTPPAIPQVIEECFSKILQKASAIGDPFERAFFTMVQLPYLQPFEDVNKRVSRLAANIPLIRGADLCLPIIRRCSGARLYRRDFGRLRNHSGRTAEGCIRVGKVHLNAPVSGTSWFEIQSQSPIGFACVTEKL